MYVRREKIGENSIILAGIYLDPRFRTLPLSGIEQVVAKKAISAIYAVGSDVEEVSNGEGQSSEDITICDAGRREAILSSH